MVPGGRIERSLHAYGAVEKAQERRAHLLPGGRIGCVASALGEQKILQRRCIELGKHALRGREYPGEFLQRNFPGGLGVEGELGFESAHLRAQSRGTDRARAQERRDGVDRSQQQVLHRLVGVGIRVRLEPFGDILDGLFRLGDIAHALSFGGIFLIGGAVVGAVHTSLKITQALEVGGGGRAHRLVLAVVRRHRLDGLEGLGHVRLIDGRVLRGNTKQGKEGGLVAGKFLKFL